MSTPNLTYLRSQLSESEERVWTHKLNEATTPVDEAVQAVRDAQHLTGKGLWDARQEIGEMSLPNY